MIRHGLSRLREKQGVELETFLGDPDIQDVVLHNLQLAVQAALDAALHVISDSGWELPRTGGGAFEVLARHGVVDLPLGERLRAAVALRNRLIHAYDTLDLERIHRIYHQDLGDLEEFCSALVAYFKL